MSNRPLTRVQARLLENLEKPLPILRRGLSQRNLSSKGRRRAKLGSRGEILPPAEGGSWMWAVLYSLLTLAIFIFVFTLFYHWLVQREVEVPPLPQPGDVVISDGSAPKGVLDMPTQMGAPVSTEGPPDSTENPYLNMYGVPGEPGWRRGIATSGFASDNVGSAYASYPNMYGSASSMYNNGYPSYPRYSRTQPYTSDYYIDAEMANVPRDQLNAYIADQNAYIQNVNDRVRQINRYRMYSRRFLRNKAELSELRDFERKLANRVAREARRQPDLPDQNPYY